MSQPYIYSDDYTQQQYYSHNSGSYDCAQTMETPIQHMQSQTSAYGYQSEHYHNGFTPSAQPVDSSSVLAQTYTYPNANYAANTPADGFSPYVPNPNPMLPHYPDSANQVPHQGVPQYGDAAPAPRWTGPVYYPEVPTIHPSELHDHRRGSCASMSTDGSWYSHDGASGGYAQPVEQNPYTSCDEPQQQPADPQMSFGMYSPAQYTRTQALARAAPYEPPSQWVSGAGVPNGNFEAPYGTLPVHSPRVKYERRSSDAYQTFDNGSVSHPQLAYGSPPAQSGAPTESPSLPSTSPSEQHSTPELPDGERRDLFEQQRQAASYQQGLQLEYQRSGQLAQFEASHRRQDSFTTDQSSYTVAHDTQHHQNHPAHHRHNSSSDQHSRLATTPIVPSQAHERVTPHAQPSPEVEEKKETPKKPALACLFCRKRKIACGPPPPDSVDRTCNQCLRRKQPCEYPTESRRGIRKTKEQVLEDPSTHPFMQGDGGSHGLTGPVRTSTSTRGRRKRAST